MEVSLALSNSIAGACIGAHCLPQAAIKRDTFWSGPLVPLPILATRSQSVPYSTFLFRRHRFGVTSAQPVGTLFGSPCNIRRVNITKSNHNPPLKNWPWCERGPVCAKTLAWLRLAWRLGSLLAPVRARARPCRNVGRVAAGVAPRSSGKLSYYEYFLAGDTSDLEPEDIAQRPSDESASTCATVWSQDRNGPASRRTLREINKYA